ncbi:hypothetical protein RYU24_07670 [Acinetobacter variabilis]|nr:hypothetical protein RYU24_07670 [Acinetobacter variabilis]
MKFFVEATVISAIRTEHPVNTIVDAAKAETSNFFMFTPNNSKNKKKAFRFYRYIF